MRTRKDIKHDAKQLLQFCRTDGLLDENRVRLVVQWLAETRRRDRFALLRQFHRLLEIECTRHAATIESAVVLPPELLSRVEAGLARTYGRGLHISYRQSPDLIGGMRVRVSSDVYDGSVRAKLEALDTRL